MRPIKIADFTPWEQKQDDDFDRIPMTTHTNFKEERFNMVSVSAINHIEPISS